VKLAVIIVTYNRRSLLEQCLLAIKSQSLQPQYVLIVDNASTDDTYTWLMEWLPGQLSHAEIIHLPENIGGAGGFYEGMKFAMFSKCDWVWMMDDDAEPESSALQNLMDAVEDKTAIYGSIALTKDGHLCWPLFSLESELFDHADKVPVKIRVPALPFLGILIPRGVIEAIGYPDTGYFIAGDDTEYCFRARDHGSTIYAVGKSRLYHPASQFYRFGIGRWAPFCFRIAPWKRYYDVRNRILTSWKFGAWHVWTRSVPAAILRLFATLINEPARLAQLRAYGSGIVDGVRRKKGMRHQRWGNKA
jgi:rhamnopyranosyl-N-acetylglucosaminyl-diphospho-decaprenol beta-1,3/1,4-galactofuranosyltransferase